MGLISRLQVVIATVVSVGAVGIMYATVGQRLVSLGESGGKHEGFLSGMVTNIDTVVPLTLVVILLAVIAWFVVATVQEERSVSRRPPR